MRIVKHENKYDIVSYFLGVDYVIKALSELHELDKGRGVSKENFNKLSKNDIYVKKIVQEDGYSSQETRKEDTEFHGNLSSHH